MAPATSRPSAARQSSLRETNLAVLTRTLFASGGGLSRADLAVRTGLTRATVSRLCQELIEAGIVDEHEQDVATGPGRPATPLHPARRTLAGLGFEVNIDYMAGRSLDLAGTVLGEFKVPGSFADSDPAAVLPQLGELAADLVETTRATGARIVGTHLALPGLVDATATTLLFAPNLGWRSVRPMGLLGNRFRALGAEVRVANDAKLQALAAATQGPGGEAKPSTFLYVSGDIGIGSAIIVDGEISGGQHGWAGELGHVSIEPFGPLCHCGSRGCLERYAGKTAVLEVAQLPPTTPSADVLRRLEIGEERVHRAVARAGWALGIAIADALNLLDLSDVVLGTGLAPLVPWLEPSLRRELATRVLAAQFVDISVVGAPEDPCPASTGGALRALQSVISRPAAWIPGD